MSDPAHDDKHEDDKERIRLLEYQVAFLHRELTFVTKRYEDMLYSAAWTLARPVKRIEDFAHWVVRRVRVREKTIAPIATAPRATVQGSLEDQIAARISAKTGRPRTVR